MKKNSTLREISHRRRHLLATLGVITLSPASTLAQTAKRPLVGVIRFQPKDTKDLFPDHFKQAMTASGWREGDTIDYRFTWTDGNNERLPALAAEMVSRKVDVIVTAGAPATKAVQNATKSIPIVCVTDDMVSARLVESMAKPGGNTTGVSILATELDAKRLEILHDAVPAAKRVGLLYDPTITRSMPAVKAAAASFGMELVMTAVASETEVAEGIRKIVSAKCAAVNVLASPILNSARSLQIREFARARLPAIYEWPDTVEQGGFIGYGPRFSSVTRQIAELVDKILRGSKPADLPIEQPTKFDLVINLKAARAMGITISKSLLVRADKVIQ